MSNMYGYRDYNGPAIGAILTVGQDGDKEKIAASSQKQHHHHHYETPYQTDDDDNDIEMDDEDGDNDNNPLQVGFWMEGDSLAPPCGTSVTTIHKILDIAFDNTDGNDWSNCCLYDLGCGDGRICLEAYDKYNCPCTVGVEIEADLVKRARFLISKLPSSSSMMVVEEGNNATTTNTKITPRRPQIVQMDLREVLDHLIRKSTVSDHVSDVTSSINDAKSDDSNKASLSENFNLPIPTIIILYLLPEALNEIEPRVIELLKLLPHLKILCNSWGLPSMKPYVEKEITDEENGAGIRTPIFVYTKESLMPEESSPVPPVR